MSGWGERIVLLSTPNAYQDEYGMFHEGDVVGREVYCNVGTLGLMTQAQLRSSEVRITSGESVPEVGMREMHAVWIKQIDYEDEKKVIFRGKEMDVISVTSEGENAKLIIRRRLGNT